MNLWWTIISSNKWIFHRELLSSVDCVWETLHYLETTKQINKWSPFDKISQVHKTFIHSPTLLRLLQKQILENLSFVNQRTLMFLSLSAFGSTTPEIEVCHRVTVIWNHYLLPLPACSFRYFAWNVQTMLLIVWDFPGSWLHSQAFVGTVSFSRRMEETKGGRGRGGMCPNHHSFQTKQSSSLLPVSRGFWYSFSEPGLWADWSLRVVLPHL